MSTVYQESYFAKGGIKNLKIRLRKYKTQTGYMSPYYLSKAYITNNVIPGQYL